MTPEIAVINASHVAADAELAAMLPAWQRYIDEYLGPAWNVSGRLSFVPLADAQGFIERDRAAWWSLINNRSDEAGDLGYHGAAPDGRPYSRIFAGDDLRYGASLSVTVTHELAEMLVDPDAQRLAQIGARSYAYEVCDAVEADEQAIDIGGVACSNFVLPAYFAPSNLGPWDYQRRLTGPAPLLTPGGYLDYALAGQWHQVTARLADGRQSYRSARSGRGERRATRG